MTLREGHTCPSCEAKLEHVVDGKLYTRRIAVEYAYGSPERYDGVSEWQCPDCDYREGRWTGKALLPDQIEPRWGRGGEPVPRTVYG